MGMDVQGKKKPESAKSADKKVKKLTLQDLKSIKGGLLSADKRKVKDKRKVRSGETDDGEL